MRGQKRGISLQEYCIENHMEYLLEEWDGEKNGNLTLGDVTAGSHKKVWWLLSYDDKKTGKHFNFSWQASIKKRIKGSGCPYLTGRKVWKGFNDLSTTHPELSTEWHPTRNGNLTPEDVTAGNPRKVWWQLSYDDERTGKHFDFEWESQISSRAKGTKCPYLSGLKAWKGFNDLATIYPKLSAEWHTTKNGNLTPGDVVAGSAKKAWWQLSYDDERTGKHFDFEWQAQIESRINGRGCPYLSGHKVWKGFNDLATVNPELAAEWDYEKNKLLPSDVTAGSRKRVWWKCKACGHRWRAAVVDRKRAGCPKCANGLQTSFPEQAVSFYLEKHFPDAENGNLDVLDGKELDVYIPSIPAAVEYDGVQYHKNKKRDMEKNQLCAEKGILLIRIREEGCPVMEDTSFLKVISCIPKNEESLADAIRQAGEILGISGMDVDISRDRQEIYSRYIKRRKENSLAMTHPKLAAQWHPTKNGSLTPENVTSGSSKKVWWLQAYDDEKTGRHFDFEWESQINSYVKWARCPYLTGHRICKGFNDLATTHPELAAQWHPARNGNLTPGDVTAGSSKKIWWLFPYYDPKTGKHFNFSWQASVVNRVKGNGCPYLSGHKIWKGFNDLATTHPELAAQWHYEKNGELTPEDVTAGSQKKVWWILSYDDKKTGRHFDFSWEARIKEMADGAGCPYLSGRKVWKGFNDLETYCKENRRLDILSWWDYEKNGSLKPSDVTIKSGKKVWWRKNGKSCLRGIQGIVNIKDTK